MTKFKLTKIQRHLNKKPFKNLLNKIKNLEGDPHYIAIGMAAGVFVAVTPTIPFHTVLAILLAILIRGSKIAAVIGVYFSNPLTIPVLYWGSYKVGNFVLLKNESFDINQISDISAMLKVGIEVTTTMIVGGLILGIIPSILTYYATKLILVYFNKKKHKGTNVCFKTIKKNES